MSTIALENQVQDILWAIQSSSVRLVHTSVYLKEITGSVGSVCRTCSQSAMFSYKAVALTDPHEPTGDSLTDRVGMASLGFSSTQQPVVT